MADREMEIFKVAMRYCHAYHDSNPDVGWGYDTNRIAELVSKNLSFPISDEDLDKAINLK